MSKVDPALVALARESRVPVTHLPAGEASAPSAWRVARDNARRAERPDNSVPVSFVLDHRGVEHARNAEGEWLY